MLCHGKIWEMLYGKLSGISTHVYDIMENLEHIVRYTINHGDKSCTGT
jgi:hypothetical protein